MFRPTARLLSLRRHRTFLQTDAITASDTCETSSMTTKITLITTGGTIGSTIKSDSVDVSQGQQQLRTHIQEICRRQQVTLSTRAALNKNSEDLIPADWLTLLDIIAEEVNNGTDKIIITHGTDTMAYTAVAVALCFRHLPVKIVLTGSCFPLDHPASDVTINLVGAISSTTEPLIANGVYVSFTTQQKQTKIIDALDIKPMSFDELSFNASFCQHIGVFNDNNSTNYQINPLARQTQAPTLLINHSDIDLAMLNLSSQRVVQLLCYPGMNAVQLCANLAAGSCVIVSLYHSGTAPSVHGENSLLQAITSRPDLTFILAALPSPYVTKPYTATHTLMRAGALLYKDLQPHLLHVVCTLGLAAGMEPDEILKQFKAHLLALPKY